VRLWIHSFGPEYRPTADFCEQDSCRQQCTVRLEKSFYVLVYLTTHFKYTSYIASNCEVVMDLKRCGLF